MLKLPGPSQGPLLVAPGTPPSTPRAAAAPRVWVRVAGGGVSRSSYNTDAKQHGVTYLPPRHEHLWHNPPWTHLSAHWCERTQLLCMAPIRLPQPHKSTHITQTGQQKMRWGRQGAQQGWSVGKGHLCFIFPYFARATTCTHILGCRAGMLQHCQGAVTYSLHPQGGQNIIPSSMQRLQLCSCTSLLYAPSCLCHRSPSHPLGSNLLHRTLCQPRLPASSPRHLQADLRTRSPALLLPLLLHPGHCFIPTP